GEPSPVRGRVPGPLRGSARPFPGGTFARPRGLTAVTSTPEGFPMGQCARLLLALVTAFALHATAADAQARKPNILVIVGDDMGYADVSAHGCKDIPTPNIDSIARNGIRCTSGYVSGPYCSPTRAGLMTGRYQTRFGHEFNPGGGGAGKNGG